MFSAYSRGEARISGLINGADMARSMDYALVPGQVYELIKKAWIKDVRRKGKAVFGE